MKRSALIAVVLLAGLANAQTTLTLRPLGTTTLLVPRQPTLTIPALTNSVNGLRTSVFSSSLSGTGTLPSTGTVAYPQSFPATSTKVNVPLELSVQPDPSGPPDDGVTGGGEGSKFNNPVVITGRTSVADYSCATSRPDFSYQPGKLNFQAQSTTDLGQVDMNFWSGLPPGTTRYVPLGEF